MWQWVYSWFYRQWHHRRECTSLQPTPKPVAQPPPPPHTWPEFKDVYPSYPNGPRAKTVNVRLEGHVIALGACADKETRTSFLTFLEKNYGAAYVAHVVSEHAFRTQQVDL